MREKIPVNNKYLLACEVGWPSELGEARNYKPWKTITPRMLKSKHIKTHTEPHIRTRQPHRYRRAYVLGGILRKYCNKKPKKETFNTDI